MFEKLVESGIRTQRGLAGKYLIVTTLIYCCGLLTAATGTVIWFNPGLAEAVELTARLAPPMPPLGPPTAPTAPRQSTGVQLGFIAPRPEPATNNPVTLPRSGGSNDRKIGLAIDRGAGGGGHRFEGGIPGINGQGRPVDPPPQPAGTPTPPPTPTPTPVETRRVSERVLQGSAIHRITPPYPEIAKRTRTQGAVRILVTISEEGQVVEASIVDGNPLLRSAALEAARRWVFTPTRLGSLPVKVQGVLTFNFVMN